MAEPFQKKRFITQILPAFFLSVSISHAQESSQPTTSALAIDPHTEIVHVLHPFNVKGDKIYEKRTHYIVDLLNLALSKSGIKYSMEPVPLNTVTGNRNTRNLISGQYSVNWMHTNIKREADLLPIRIPIFKGLIGWRVMLIRKESQPRFSKTRNIEALKLLTAGQGHDWPDTTILQRHGFNVITSTSRESLVNMVVGKRIDYFPRSIIEIWDELDVHANEGLTVEKKIAVVYPSAYYYFVRPDNRRLADAIERGLTTAINDGSFDTLLYRFYGDSLARTRLDQRNIFFISNPTLTAETPLHQSNLWYSLPK